MRSRHQPSVGMRARFSASEGFADPTDALLVALTDLGGAANGRQLEEATGMFVSALRDIASALEERGMITTSSHSPERVWIELTPVGRHWCLRMRDATAH